MLFLVPAGWWTWGEWFPQPDERFTIPSNFLGDSHEVEVEAFLPHPSEQGPQRFPAVVLLHGVEGPKRYRSSHSRTARWLADHGYAVFFVHYFNGTGYEDLWILNGEGELDLKQIDAACRRDAGRWTAAATQAMQSIAARPDIDGERIALDGTSLGGFVALSAAVVSMSEDGMPVPSAVVVNWGALFETTIPTAGFPPTLFVHGEHDNVVPLAAARAAAATIRAAQSDARLFIVPGASHVARSPESDEATLKFLTTHLQMGPTEPLIDTNREIGSGAAFDSAWSIADWTWVR